VKLKTHLMLLAQTSALWAVLWAVGLPSYYQQYSPALLGVASVFLATGLSLLALWLLVRVPRERQMQRALWMSVYFTVPFALLDTCYCGIYLGHGVGFLIKYWYLSCFYVAPWFTLVPTAMILRKSHEAR
jgi:hypothetical protein